MARPRKASQKSVRVDHGTRTPFYKALTALGCQPCPACRDLVLDPHECNGKPAGQNMSLRLFVSLSMTHMGRALGAPWAGSEDGTDEPDRRPTVDG